MNFHQGINNCYRRFSISHETLQRMASFDDILLDALFYASPTVNGIKKEHLTMQIRVTKMPTSFVHFHIAQINKNLFTNV